MSVAPVTTALGKSLGIDNVGCFDPNCSENEDIENERMFPEHETDFKDLKETLEDVKEFPTEVVLHPDVTKYEMSVPIGFGDINEEHDKKVDHVLISRAIELGVTPQDLSRVILFTENTSGPFKSIQHGTIEYRVALDDLSRELGLDASSPIALTLRARQMACAGNYRTESTALDIPKYDKEGSQRIVTKGHQYVEGIILRAQTKLDALAASPIQSDHLLAEMRLYAAQFARERKDIDYSIFGVGDDYDPSYSPSDLSNITRKEIVERASQVDIHYTKESAHSDHPIYGAFWKGHEIAAGERLSFIRGEIKTSCDNIGTKYMRHLFDHGLLIDQSNIHASNWTREVLKTLDVHKSNVMFASDGSVITTHKVKSGEQLLEYVH